MTWVTIGETASGEPLYGRLDEDRHIRVTCVAEHPEFAKWVAEGNVPEPYTLSEGGV